MYVPRALLVVISRLLGIDATRIEQAHPIIQDIYVLLKRTIL